MSGREYTERSLIVDVWVDESWRGNSYAEAEKITVYEDTATGILTTSPDRFEEWLNANP